ncbi:hypothetical protein J2Y41_001459 [Arthrobacter sp. 1088]|nr:MULTISPECIES: hypothetical protein [unclassified Arthrobacter]MDR6685901.1 hypothetical protein [Arthrobacter sp. 1088]
MARESTSGARFEPELRVSVIDWVCISFDTGGLLLDSNGRRA